MGKESILKGEAALARKLHAQKETTGRVINRPPSKEYAEGWERVFGKKKGPVHEPGACPFCDTWRRESQP